MEASSGFGRCSAKDNIETGSTFCPWVQLLRLHDHPMTKAVVLSVQYGSCIRWTNVVRGLL